VSFAAVSANAQSGIDIFAGAGTATDSSSHSLIDTFNTGIPFESPKLGGTFGKFGAGIMLTPYLGVNGEADLRLSQGAYAGLNYRPTFYDFNAVFLPFGRHGRITPELEAGLGGMNMRFFYPQSYCDSFAGCSSSNSYVESSNHLQVHLSAGIRFYVTSHFFIRPQIDAHYVNNLFQFGNAWVPEYGAAIGYTFGER
jgi:hypothetical protein